MRFVILCALVVGTLQDPAPTCSNSICDSAGCRCSSIVNPYTGDPQDTPQFIGITVSESVVNTLYDNYLAPLFFDRLNPDDMPIGITLYVNHEYTNYSLVQDLWLRGNEIGVHSITKNPSQVYWTQNATVQQLVDEFQGQKTILHTFANIPPEDITGVRTPQLQIRGDVSFEVYAQSELEYDNSWPTPVAAPIFPYTLDYASSQQCTASLYCPKESHEGFWVVPITDIEGGSSECNSLATCDVSGSANEISAWLIKQLERVRSNNRAPIVLRLDSYWFSFTENSYEGFAQFLDALQNYDDVFLVSVQDILEWVKNPVGLNQYQTPDHTDRDSTCRLNNCPYTKPDGTPTYMGSCIPCPPEYPWLGNPLGETAK